MTLTDSLTRLDRLQRRLAAAFAMTESDMRTLADSIMAERVYAWQRRLEELARAVGGHRPGQGPSGGDRAYLFNLSITDARGIVQTFNNDLAREIARLYTENPDYTRDQYILKLSRWAADRATWKDKQIALMNEKTARAYAQDRFRQMNRVLSQFRFTGPAPVCDDCADELAAGVVDEAHIIAHPAPLHPNCPHEWTLAGPKLGIPVRDLWTG